MNDPSNKLRETNWRRPLTPAEAAELRAWLAAHPEARADWEAEARLNTALGRLPDAPVPSNFTALVLTAVERDAAVAAPRRGPRWQIWLWSSWVPRAAFAALVLGAGGFAYRHNLTVRRLNLARSVAAVSQVASLPNPAILQDFDAIQQMNASPAADTELLALLQ